MKKFYLQLYHHTLSNNIQKLLRLRRNPGINLPGAAVILNLMERIKRLEEEIAQLKRR